MCVDMYTHLVFCLFNSQSQDENGSTFSFNIMKMYMVAINFKIAHSRGPFTRS